MADLRLDPGALRRRCDPDAFSFATTYALGEVAKRYYAGGRVLSAQMLQEAYAGMSREALALQDRYLPAIRERARTLDAGKVLSLVRGA